MKLDDPLVEILDLWKDMEAELVRGSGALEFDDRGEVSAEAFTGATSGVGG